MKQTLCLFFTFVSLVGVQAAALDTSDEDRIFKGMCLIGNVWVNDGEDAVDTSGTLLGPSCTSYKCHSDQATGEYRLSAVGCSSYIDGNPRCVLVPEDNTKRFPDCCPRYECEDENEIQ